MVVLCGAAAVADRARGEAVECHLHQRRGAGRAL